MASMTQTSPQDATKAPPASPPAVVPIDLVRGVETWEFSDAYLIGWLSEEMRRQGAITPASWNRAIEAAIERSRRWTR